MQDPELDDLGVSMDQAEELLERQEKESYELMRICRLNRIKIKNPEKWDKAKYEDFVENQYIQSDNKTNKSKSVKRKTEETESQSKAGTTMLTINEEVTIFEYAPKKFQEIREMDKIDRDMIKKSLSAKRNRDQAF